MKQCVGVIFVVVDLYMQNKQAQESHRIFLDTFWNGFKMMIETINVFAKHPFLFVDLNQIPHSNNSSLSLFDFNSLSEQMARIFMTSFSFENNPNDFVNLLSRVFSKINNLKDMNKNFEVSFCELLLVTSRFPPNEQLFKEKIRESTFYGLNITILILSSNEPPSHLSVPFESTNNSNTTSKFEFTTFDYSLPASVSLQSPPRIYQPNSGMITTDSLLLSRLIFDLNDYSNVKIFHLPTSIGYTSASILSNSQQAVKDMFHSLFSRFYLFYSSISSITPSTATSISALNGTTSSSLVDSLLSSSTVSQPSGLSCLCFSNMGNNYYETTSSLDLNSYFEEDRGMEYETCRLFLCNNAETQQNNKTYNFVFPFYRIISSFTSFGLHEDECLSGINQINGICLSLNHMDSDSVSMESCLLCDFHPSLIPLPNLSTSLCCSIHEMMLVNRAYSNKYYIGQKPLNNNSTLMCSGLGHLPNASNVSVGVTVGQTSILIDHIPPSLIPHSSSFVSMESSSNQSSVLLPDIYDCGSWIFMKIIEFVSLDGISDSHVFGNV
jgi:hypothetical protein